MIYFYWFCKYIFFTHPRTSVSRSGEKRTYCHSAFSSKISTIVPLGKSGIFLKLDDRFGVSLNLIKSAPPSFLLTKAFFALASALPASASCLSTSWFCKYFFLIHPLTSVPGLGENPTCCHSPFSPSNISTSIPLNKTEPITKVDNSFGSTRNWVYVASPSFLLIVAFFVPAFLLASASCLSCCCCAASICCSCWRRSSIRSSRFFCCWSCARCSAACCRERISWGVNFSIKSSLTRKP